MVLSMVDLINSMDGITTTSSSMSGRAVRRANLSKFRLYRMLSFNVGLPPVDRFSDSQGVIEVETALGFHSNRITITGR